MDNLGISADLLLRSLSSLFIAILFIQSGVDKVVNWKGEKEFYTSHFKKSILKGTVPILMPVITISELAAGFLSGIGLIMYVAGGSPNLAFLGMLLANLSIIQLFFGQRVAKDFAGAASLVPYFLLTVVGLYLYLS
ncbi:MAG: DoxX family protein [Saprospiraceae bacterium]|nr:DoxX family protein [Saprospiraceae bacterium]